MKFVIAALIGIAACVDTNKDYFTVFDHESTYYERATPARFASDTDDIFMRSMIEHYAMEEKTEDSAPAVQAEAAGS